jgi:cellulose synthase (UDP-forming)
MAVARSVFEPLQPYVVDLASRAQQWQYRALVVGWLAGQVWFWSWWLRQDHVVTPAGMLINSLVLLWTTFLPGWYFFLLGRTRRPNPAMPLPTGRVAMVVTKAPSEPWSVVRKTLDAMLAQAFPRPYDVWLADEDPSFETRAWCAEHGVQLSCRKGVAGYHNRRWPHRTRCKEGNLAYFYEVMGGYDRYDFVSQLDADHMPEPTYLAEMIRAFADPTVGYVAAPSVCDANSAESWAARGRLYAEAAWHGSVQAGYNADFAPQCIGSHYAVRTLALRDSGGIGPELAEDFSTTLLMNANGWRGAFALDAFAHGDGPASVSDCITQEFQWSRSVINIFLGLWSRRGDQLPLHLKIQLGFAQVWYLLFTLHMLLVYSMPVVALMSGTPWVDVHLLDFLVRITIPTTVALLALIWTRRQGWLRPATAPVLSWEAMLFEYVRWPWMVLGIVHALVGHVLDREFTFRVTPKGVTGLRPLPVRILVPYLVIVLVESGVTLLVDHPGAAVGYAYLALVAALSYMVVIVAVVGLQFRENGRLFSMPRRAGVRSLLKATPVPTVSSLLVGVTIALRGQVVLATMVPGLSPAGFGDYDGSATSVLRAAAPAPVLQTATPAVLPMDLPAGRLSVGAYDPSLALADQPLDIEHWFVRQDDPTLLAGALAHAQNRRTLMVTVEPWPAVGSADSDVLGRVVSGGADEHLRALAQVAAAHQPQVVLMRWGHEMDLDNLYPWGAQDPGEYRQAFRRVVSIFRQEGADNVRFVWSPAGDESAAEYYPGANVVDYVGVTALADATWDAGFGLEPQSFDDIVGPRYARLAPLGKPMIVAELGVSGSPERQAEWLSAAGRSLAAYPRLNALVYFDAQNPPVNRISVEPDWRLSPSPAAAFLSSQPRLR